MLGVMPLMNLCKRKVKIKAKDDVDDDGNDDEEKFYFSNNDLSQAMWVAIKDAGNLDLAGMLLSTYDIKINAYDRKTQNCAYIKNQISLQIQIDPFYF